MKAHQILHSNERESDRGFTLLELLVVLAIITFISVLGLSAYKSVMSKVAMTTELSAAKNLISAYALYAADNNGRLLPGVANYPGDITDKNGKVISKIVSKRWVPRLAAYFDYQYPGTVVVNDMRKIYSQQFGKRPILGMPAGLYIASTFPTFGLNGTFVGGNHIKPLDGTGAFPSEPTIDEVEEYGSFYAETMAQVSKPGQLIVFASARYKDHTGTQYGNEYIYAPRSTGGLRWASEFKEEELSGTFGHVHPRWEGKAVTAMLDGSVKMMTAEELKDMRHWSHLAAEENNPEWCLQSAEEVSTIASY